MQLNVCIIVEDSLMNDSCETISVRCVRELKSHMCSDVVLREG